MIALVIVPLAIIGVFASSPSMQLRVLVLPYILSMLEDTAPDQH